MDENLIDRANSTITYSNSGNVETPTENAIEIEKGYFYWVNPEQIKYLGKNKLEEKLTEEKDYCCFRSSKKVGKKVQEPEEIETCCGSKIARTDNFMKDSSLNTNNIIDSIKEF